MAQAHITMSSANPRARGEEAATLVFANCAGAARGETCNPAELAGGIQSRLGDAKVKAIGLAEVILAVDPGPPVKVPCVEPSLTPLDRIDPVPAAGLDDLTAFQSGLGPGHWHRYYLSHLNSVSHPHPGKWSSKRFSDHLGRHIYQGTAALLASQCAAEGIELRPAGRDGVTAGEYEGNRDTEPRSALVFRGLELADDLAVDFCICQLETHTEDRPKAGHPGASGRNHRIEQVKRLKQYLGNRGLPTILMGDFNTRADSLELRGLLEGGADSFRPVPPTGNPSDYTHLKHRIPIDHAYVRGLDDRWTCELRFLALDDEDDEARRVSDHRPIALTIYRRAG